MFAPLFLLLPVVALAQEPDVVPLADSAVDESPSDKPCTEPASALMSAAQEFANQGLVYASQNLNDFVEGTQCSAQLTPELAAHYFQVKGAVLQAKGDLSDAQQAFASAKAIAPDAWYSDGLGFEGTPWKKAFDGAPAIEGGGAQIAIGNPANLGRTEWVAVDGTIVAAPYHITPGLHLVQVGEAGQSARYAREIDAVPDKALNLDLNSAVEPALPPSMATLEYTTRSTPQQRKTRLRTAGLLTGGAAAALFGSAVGSRMAYENNTSDGLRTSTNTLQVGSIGAAVASGTLVSASLAVKI